MTLREILVEIARLVGRRPPRVRLPTAVLLPIAYVAEARVHVSPAFQSDHRRGCAYGAQANVLLQRKGRPGAGIPWRPAGARPCEDAVVWLREQGLHVAKIARSAGEAPPSPSQWQARYPHILPAPAVQRPWDARLARRLVTPLKDTPSAGPIT